MCYCLAQAEQYCSLKFISMYHTFLWLCKCGDEKLANSTAVELLAGAYLPLSPVANNISPSTHRHAVFLFSTQRNTINNVKGMSMPLNRPSNKQEKAKQPLNKFPNVKYRKGTHTLSMIPPISY